ncbi:MAG: sugar transferase [Bacteroidota bacterium]
MMNLHSTVAESVVVLKSKAKHTKKLLYLIGFDDQFVSDVVLGKNGNAYEIVQKQHLNEISIAGLVKVVSQKDLRISLICDYEVLKRNQFQFLEQVRAEKVLRNIPFIVINLQNSNLDFKELIHRGIDDAYNYPLNWDNILTRIKFLSNHKPKIQRHNVVKNSNYNIPLGKRIFDIVVASVALIFLSPILLLIALLIKLESKGPVLYSSKRAGTNYHVFDFLKFRSMVVDADQKLKDLDHLNQYANQENCGPSFTKIHNDPRVTKVGKFIRKTSLDELPQLINVLKGDMSIIGNRPLPLYEAEQLTTDLNARRFIAPAGLTGLWQVSKRGKKDMSIQERIDLDVEYALKHSFLMDIKIVAKTLPAMIQEESV